MHSIIFSIPNNEINYWLDKAKGDVTLAETLFEIDTIRIYNGYNWFSCD